MMEKDQLWTKSKKIEEILFELDDKITNYINKKKGLVSRNNRIPNKFSQLVFNKEQNVQAASK